MIDGGPGAAPGGRLDAWLVTDERAELIGAIRRLARAKGLRPYAGSFRKDGVGVERRRLIHTNHPTYYVVAVARGARRLGVKRLVFAHIGRPTVRALSRGKRPPFGEQATDGQAFLIGRKRKRRRPARAHRR